MRHLFSSKDLHLFLDDAADAEPSGSPNGGTMPSSKRERSGSSALGRSGSGATGLRARGAGATKVLPNAR